MTLIRLMVFSSMMKCFLCEMIDQSKCVNPYFLSRIPPSRNSGTPRKGIERAQKLRTVFTELHRFEGASVGGDKRFFISINTSACIFSFFFRLKQSYFFSASLTLNEIREEAKYIYILKFKV